MPKIMQFELKTPTLPMANIISIIMGIKLQITEFNTLVISLYNSVYQNVCNFLEDSRNNVDNTGLKISKLYFILTYDCF